MLGALTTQSSLCSPTFTSQLLSLPSEQVFLHNLLALAHACAQEVAESATNVTYLKNVVLKLLETGEGDALLPILSRLLQFSPDEAQRAHKAMADAAAPPLPAAAAAVDAMGSAVSMLSSYLNTTTTTTSAATGSGAASASTTTTPRS